MAGIPSGNMTLTRLLIMMTMLLSYEALLQGQIGHADIVHMEVVRLFHHHVLSPSQGHFFNNGRPFVGIHQDLRAISKQISRETCKETRDLQVIASPAICPDTLPETARTPRDSWLVSCNPPSQQKNQTPVTESRVKYFNSYVSKKFEKNDIISVKDSINRHIDFWVKNLKVNTFIEDVIRNGFKIPFETLPSSIYLRNNLSSVKHHTFVSSAISELLEKQCVIEVKSKPFCVNPLTVSVNSNGKERLILDLRHINKHVLKRKVKFEGQKEALDFCQKGNLMFKFDLKSGYHHVSINKEYQTYLGFSWVENGVHKYFVFTVLPFGISIAPWLFTKLLRPLVKYWRGMGIKIIVYLDDGWGTDSPELCYKVSSQVREDLIRAGLIANEEKSQWEPCSVLEWLGSLWDLSKGLVEIPIRKIEKLKHMILSCMQNQGKCTARSLAKIVGTIISMSFCFGNVCHIMTRNLHVPISNSVSWDAIVSLDSPSLAELHFWSKNLELLPFRSLVSLGRMPERILFVDASNQAAAGVLLSSIKKVSRVSFTEIEVKQSSTFRELRSLEIALQSLRNI